MNRTISEKLYISFNKAKEALSKLTPSQKRDMEKSWDVEHAYYSSTLEGSKIDRKDFEKLAESIQ